jgi:predicted ATPase
MAKKVVATLKKEGGQNIAKCIKMIKNPETGHYQFKEAIMDKDFSKEFFSKK